MPVITVDYKDLIHLIGECIDQKELLEKIPMMGADIDRVEGNEMAIEFFPDRPDLLSVEGVARALRSFLNIDSGMCRYDIAAPKVTLKVDRSVKSVRPFIGAAIIRSIHMSEKLLVSMMELQEKLHLSVGKERTKMAIGLHNIDAVTPPFLYKSVKPKEQSFIPLNETSEMTLDEILQRHDKGITYAHILEGHDSYPIILDLHDNVLSFPPIINGELTAVDLFTENLFVDVTGTEANAVTTALTIITTALAERGGLVEAVNIDDKPPRVMPDFSPREMKLNIDYASRLLGMDISNDAVNAVKKMGYSARIKNGLMVLEIPPWRSDILHPVDLVEDIAIGFGYGQLAHRLPNSMTIGQQMSWQPLHEIMIGLGFNEVVTLSLSSQDDQFERMGLPITDTVRIANPLTSKHTIVRVSLIPSLLDILSKNRHNELPQMIYEIGDVVWMDKGQPYNITMLAGVKIDSRTGFTECKSLVEAVLRNTGTDAEIAEQQHPSFTKGRCASVMNLEKIGYFGEIHPSVIFQYNLDYPVIAFEIKTKRLTVASHE